MQIWDPKRPTESSWNSPHRLCAAIEIASDELGRPYWRMGKLRSLHLVASMLLLASAGRAQVLFDGTQGLPAQQGWTFFATGGSQSLNNGGVQWDTSAANSYQGGYSLTAPTALKRTNGFTLEFTLQVPTETHANTNRAGFSVILLADDRSGVELGFWTNTIFAQTDSPLFTHGEDTNFSISAGFVTYALTLRATDYVLRADGTPILTGPIRNYEAFTGFPDPYSTPNFMFFGDDTTSAGGVLALKKVVLVTPPRLSLVGGRLLSWTGVAGQSYTVLASSNLVNWESVQTVTATNNNFSYTNNSSEAAQFFRVSYP